MIVSGNQIRAARALAGIDQEGLAITAGVMPQTIGRLEASGRDPVSGRAQTLQAVLSALAAHGLAMVPGGLALIQQAQKPDSDQRATMAIRHGGVGQYFWLTAARRGSIFVSR